MAPIQQNINEVSNFENNSAANSMQMTSSSKIQSSNKSTSSSISSNNSSFSDSRKSSLDVNASSKDWLEGVQDSLLPIATRGLFYNDSFFEDTRKNFDKAVKEVLDQWGQRSEQTDDITSYRNLREVNLQEGNQAVSVSEDETNHKVVLDVKDFMKGDIKVKMIDENELVVEGTFEKQDGGCVSKKSFQRSFTFPGLVKGDGVSSAMSTDGILAVTVPKAKQQGQSSKNITNRTKLINNSIHTSNISNSQKVSSQDARMRDTNQDFSPESLLPVSHKGLFFHDDFFASARENFEKAVQEVLSRSEKTESVSDHMSSYRTLRETDLKEENQAVSVTEDHQCHKVVMDVRDFIQNDLKVKVVDENELVIEGVTEKKDEGSVSKKSFQRRFVFPGLVNSDAITSTMSSDGVLIITVPKNLKVQNSSKSIHIENNHTDNTASETRNISSVNSTSKLCSSVQSAKGNHSSKVASATAKSLSSISNSNLAKDLHINQDVDSFSPESLLPVSHKGLFFHDDFFASARENFEKAVQEVLSRSEKTESVSDHMSSYRTLRETDLKEENQAVSVTEDHQCHKVVMDVRDFIQNDLKVKVIDENELVIEGVTEKKDEGSVSKKSFQRRFVFPGLVNSDAITSTMSSDGVLIITVPKNLKVQNSSKSIHIENNHTDNTASETRNLSSVNSTSKLCSSVQSAKGNHSSKVASATAKSLSSISNSNLAKDLHINQDVDSFSPESLLPVSHKGLFFHDDFFASARENFEKAVQEVLSRSEKTESVSDHMSSYRTLRETDLKEENQAVSVTEDHQCHKVVMDVRDFIQNDLKVKVIDENELVIEGVTEKKDEGSVSKKSFQRRFVFPGLVNSDAITSTMSSDGVLIITVPKNLKVQNSSKSIHIENNHTDNTASETRNLSSVNSTSKLSSSVQSAKGNHSSKVASATAKSLSSISNSNLAKDLHINQDVDSFSPESLLPVSHKGLFFHDDFFASARENFEKAVQEVLSRSEKTESVSDHMSSYRTLRETDLKEENQAVSVTEDHQCHKVVMDVRDFIQNDLKVKVIDENELVIEGVTEKKDEGSVSKKSFQRRFVFPGLVNSDAITSTMSSDGVLIITVPKNLKTQNSSKSIHIENNHTDNTASETRNLSSVNSTSQFSSNSIHHTGMNNSGLQDSSLDHHYRNNVLENMISDDLSLSGMGSNIHEEFFTKAHRDFEASSRKMFNQSHELMSSADEQTLLHNTLQPDNKDKDQGLSMSEDAHCHKVEIDLKDFAGGDLQVKALEHNELLVEGHLEKEKGGKSSNKSFSRRVQLPGLIKVDEITSILSKDGILTIKAPKDSRKSCGSHNFSFSR